MPTEKKSPPHPGLGQYIKRAMLEVPGVKSGDGLQVSIMTYNVLAQGLIKRERFPTCGKALKWNVRRKILDAEIRGYDPDILCLQEVDDGNWAPFWQSTLRSLGYEGSFYKDAAKTHGVAIFWKKDKFTNECEAHFDYDAEESGQVSNTVKTGNVGLLVSLNFSETCRAQHPSLTKDGLIVGTTHLFWHPFGTFERTRQTYILMHKVRCFQEQLEQQKGRKLDLFRFVAGDFNSQSFDTPYLSITAKPADYKDMAKSVLAAACAHDFEDRNYKQKKLHIDEIDDVTSAKLDMLQELHNALPVRATSLYSLAYHLVHEENSNIDNNRNEPTYSNWAHVWAGLLDYICVVSEWDGSTLHAEKVETPAAFEAEANVRLLSLLRMPTEAELGPREQTGLPQIGMYPSDHLCMMARVELT